MSEHVSECITAGLTSSAGMENDLVSVVKPISHLHHHLLLVAVLQLLLFFKILRITFFHSLPVSSLPPVTRIFLY